MDTQEIVNALLDPELDDDMICSMQPVNVEKNTVFIVDLGKLKNIKDLYCDDMGSWQYNGVYHSWLTVNDAGFVSTMGKEKPLQLLTCTTSRKSTSSIEPAVTLRRLL